MYSDRCIQELIPKAICESVNVLWTFKSVYIYVKRALLMMMTTLFKALTCL